MSAAKKQPTRKRSALTEMQQRAWTRDWRAMLVRDAAHLPPMPNPTEQPREFKEWMQKHAQRELSPEWQQLFEDLRQLPPRKYRRARDDEIWSWIKWLLACQGWGAPYDLSTCSLGANPVGGAKPSRMLPYLLATVKHEYPDVTPVRLYDAIRNWRKSVGSDK